MKGHTKVLLAMALGMHGLPCLAAAAAQKNPMCPLLRAFAASVEKDETRALEFHTIWGGGFKDSATANQSLYAKRCTSSGYAPGEAVCDYLMQNGAVEFSEKNAEDAITCLSPETRFSQRLRMEQVDVEFHYGSERRGSNIKIIYSEDKKSGGMVLNIKADGY